VALQVLDHDQELDKNMFPEIRVNDLHREINMLVRSAFYMHAVVDDDGA
jgi:hypothetical protein